jgi:hypothetical protein
MAAAFIRAFADRRLTPRFSGGAQRCPLQPDVGPNLKCHHSIHNQQKSD